MRLRCLFQGFGLPHQPALCVQGIGVGWRGELVPYREQLSPRRGLRPVRLLFAHASQPYLCVFKPGLLQAP